MVVHIKIRFPTNSSNLLVYSKGFLFASFTCLLKTQVTADSVDTNESPEFINSLSKCTGCGYMAQKHNLLSSVTLFVAVLF